jgi:hypothetical protein
MLLPPLLLPLLPPLLLPPQELEGMVQRAAAQTDPEQVEGQAKPRGRADAAGQYTGISRSLSGSLALDKDVFWFAAQNKDRFR